MFTPLKRKVALRHHPGLYRSYYQPLVNGKTGEIYGVEILARWQNSTTRALARGIYSVGRTYRLNYSLTRSLMAQVNAQMRPLFSKLPDGFHIGLNISVSHINAPTLSMTACTISAALRAKR